MKEFKWLGILISSVTIFGLGLIFYFNATIEDDEELNYQALKLETKPKTVANNSDHLKLALNSPGIQVIKHSEKVNPFDGISEQEKRYGKLPLSALKNKLATDLSPVDRNYLEQKLAGVIDPNMDTSINEMLEDGFMDLSIENEGEGIDGAEQMGAPAIANSRMNSAIRIAGLREDKTSITKIIDLATHFNAEEDTLRAAYEALGYIGGSEAVSFLQNQFNKQDNPFLKSELILSLTTAGSASNVEEYLKLLFNKDIDLKNSAITALGELKEERAIDPFRQVFKASDYSSQVLIVQAAYKINTPSSKYFLTELSKTHKTLVDSLSNIDDEDESEG